MTTAVPPAVAATIETLAGDPRRLEGTERVALVGQIEAVRSWVAAREATVLAIIHESRDDVDAGAKDTTQLSQRRANVAFGEAKRRSLRATWSTALPALGAALETGRIGAAIADELCALADRLRPERRPTLQASIDTLIDDVAAKTPPQARKHLVAWEASLDDADGIDRTERQRRNNAFRLSRNPDGTSRISGNLDPVAADELSRIIDQRVGQLWRAESLNRQNADVPQTVLSNDARRMQALLDLVRGGAMSMPGNSPSANVIVLIDHQTLLGELSAAPTCRLPDGSPISPAEARRLACDARILPIVMGSSSQPLDVGREARTATSAQRGALRVIHPTCGVHRCDVAFEHCQIHHIDWWRLGGRTDLANLIPLCSKHHHLVHDHRWDLQIGEDRVARLVRRDDAVPASPRPHHHEAPLPAQRRRDRTPPAGRRAGPERRFTVGRSSAATATTADRSPVASEVPMRC